MNHRRDQLNKDIRMIFNGTALPEDVASHCPVVPAPAPRALDPKVTTGAPQTAVPMVSVGAPVRPMKDRRIEDLMGSVACAKDHACYRSGLETLCRARPLMGGRLLECLEKGSPCPHRFSLLYRALCRCAIRRHIARKFGR